MSAPRSISLALTIPLGIALVAALPLAAPAQVLFREDAPLVLTLTTNLRELTKERDSTELKWFGAELAYTDAQGVAQKVPTELRARGHFRRQARNCTFPPLFIRSNKEARDSTLLQGNPRLKIVTPCRPGSGDYQQYILLEYLVYRTYALLDSVHHRTRLARITYRDSADKMKPVEVTAFLMEVEAEVADEHGLKVEEQQGARWEDLVAAPLDLISLFNFWIGNTDWSLSALHNVTLFRMSTTEFRPVAYDFDWSGAVGARYAFPNAKLGIRTIKDRLHRGPCRTAAEWAPTIAHFQAKRAAVDSLWATPIEGLDPKMRDEAKKYLDQLWPILSDARRFKRDVIDACQPSGN